MRSKASGFLIALVLANAPGHATAACQVVQYAELPVTMVDTRPFITGSVNGVRAYFLADSGAFFSMLSRESAEKFNLQLGPLPRGMNIRGVGGAADARMAKTNEFSLKGLGWKFQNVEFIVGGNAFATGSAGIIGQNVLGRGDTEYDLANGFIRLFQATDCVNRAMAYWHGSADVAVVGIKYTSQWSPHLIGTATLNGSTIRVLFDTGASHSLLSLKAAAHAGFKSGGAEVIAGAVGQGVGRQFVETWIARFDSFSLGGEEIKNARLRIGDVDLLGEADMLLGADFFLSHRLYVAPSQQRIFFTYNGGPVFDLSITKKPTDTAASAADAGAATAGGEDTHQALTNAADLRRRWAASEGRGDFASALADFGQAIQLAPTDPESYYRRAMARWHERQPELVLADFDQALTIKPRDSAILLDRGSLRLQLKDESGARADFDVIATLHRMTPVWSCSSPRSTKAPATLMRQSAVSIVGSAPIPRTTACRRRLPGAAGRAW